MTTILAVKLNNQICIGSDSLATYGLKKEVHGGHIKAHSKLLSVGENIIGISGHASWSLVLKDYFATHSYKDSWKTSHEIFQVFNELHHTLRDSYFHTSPNLEFVPFESSEFTILIANPFGIFEVDYQRVVRQFKRYNAIGTGEAFAVGALEAMYDLGDNAESLAKVALEASSHFDLKTSGPFELRTISSLR